MKWKTLHQSVMSRNHFWFIMWGLPWEINKYIHYYLLFYLRFRTISSKRNRQKYIIRKSLNCFNSLSKIRKKKQDVLHVPILEQKNIVIIKMGQHKIIGNWSLWQQSLCQKNSESTYVILLSTETLHPRSVEWLRVRVG
jgi:hypothetical protein